MSTTGTVPALSTVSRGSFLSPKIGVPSRKTALPNLVKLLRKISLPLRLPSCRYSSRRIALTSAAAACLLTVVPRALAVSTSYALANSSNVTLDSEKIATTPVGYPIRLGYPGPRNVFELNDGESFKDNSFTIYLVPQGPLSDLGDSKISATIYLENSVTGVIKQAITFEGSFVFGQSKWGQIEWSTPAQTFIENTSALMPSKFDDRTFTVALSDGLLYPGALGELPSTGSTYLATVGVSVTQISSAFVADSLLGDEGTFNVPSVGGESVGGFSSARSYDLHNSVPDGDPTVMLLGVAICVIAVARRKFGS